MSPPAGTRDEYSRGNGASGHVSGRESGPLRRRYRGRFGPGIGPSASGGSGARLTFPRAIAWVLVAGTLAGAAVLVVAEFSTLCTVHVQGTTHLALPACGPAGAHHHYALIPIALLVILLGFAALGGGGRYALGAMAVVAVVALLIGLLHDLPAAQQSRTALRLGGKYLAAFGSPSTGMYMETLGAVIVLITAGFGLLLGQPAAPNIGQAHPGRSGQPDPGRSAD
jgi:hypothetical protein